MKKKLTREQKIELAITLPLIVIIIAFLMHWDANNAAQKHQEEVKAATDYLDMVSGGTINHK
jgi:hypothetical protein